MTEGAERTGHMLVGVPMRTEFKASRLHTFQTEHRAGEGTSDRAVVRVVLPSEVGGGVLAEHVRSTHGSCASSQSCFVSQCTLSKSF
jgi:hypothetical protein